MDLFDNLAAHGLTIAVLQTLFVFAGLLFAVYIIGFYWKHILAGLALIFGLVVFAMPPKNNVAPIVPPVQQEKQIEPKSEEVKPEPPVVETKPETKPEVAQTDEEMFMEDCVKYGGYTKSQCGALWLERLDEEKKVKFRKTFNRIQMMKVRYAA